jgi:copper(I)-binding protein
MNKTAAYTVIFLMMCVVPAVFAQQPLMVHDAWVRPAPPGAKVLAAYMIIMNGSAEQRALTMVSCSLFDRVEIHRTEMQEGMMKMIPQERLTVPAGGSVTLEPGGFHLMLIGPKSVPKQGEEVDMEFHFDNGQALHLKVPVRAGGDKGGMMEHGHH